MRQLLVVGLAGLAMMPLVFLVSGSMGSGESAYAAVLREGGFWRALANSAFLASAQTLAGLVLASLAGFVLATHRTRLARPMLVAILGLSALPPQLLLPGGFEVVAGLGLFDSRWAVLVPGSLNLLAAVLYRSAFRALPGDVLEAARMDGAGEWRVWSAVAMPMVRPTTAALMVLSFAGSWNAVVWPMLVLQRSELHTLPMRVTILAGNAIGPKEQAVVMAATVLGILPVLGLFLLLQREFLPGLKGAVKG